MAGHETAKDLAQYLSTGGVGVQGASLFTHVLPETTGAALAIIETPGMLPQPTYGSKIPSIARPRVQVMARTTAPSSGATVPYTSNARLLIHDAWARLSHVVNQSIRSTTYLSVDPLQDPFQMGRDEKGRILFAFNAQVSKVPST